MRRLVLIGASPGLADRPSARPARATTPRSPTASGRSASTRSCASGARSRCSRGCRAGWRSVDEDRRRNTAPGLAAALRGLGTGVMPSLWDRLGTLDVPVALVVGERDEKFRAIAERMEAALPSASLHVVAGAGHAVHLEAPDTLVDLLARAD